MGNRGQYLQVYQSQYWCTSGRKKWCQVQMKPVLLDPGHECLEGLCPLYTPLKILCWQDQRESEPILALSFQGGHTPAGIFRDSAPPLALHVKSTLLKVVLHYMSRGALTTEYSQEVNQSRSSRRSHSGYGIAKELDSRIISKIENLNRKKISFSQQREEIHYLRALAKQ